MKILALDIGGANTKVLVYSDGRSDSSMEYFPFWREKHRFKEFLSSLEVDEDLVTVTITAELCDVFSSKAQGTRFIAESCNEIFNDPYFLTSDGILKRLDRIADFNSLAATNWLASLYFMKKRFEQGILVDIGSTTTDIIPFGLDKQAYKSDFERLKASQLIYTGLLRTPVNTIVSEVPVNGERVPITSEYFALTADVYNILWGVDYSCATPDGNGKSQDESATRIARLLCADTAEVKEFIPEICIYVYETQVKNITTAIERVSEDLGMSKVYVTGIGKILGLDAAKSLDLEVSDLENEIADAWNLPCLGLLEMTLDLRAK
jgi:probable H4MPT-linked C1 transfer pathway protein